MIRLCKMNVMVLVGLGMLVGCQDRAGPAISQSSEDADHHQQATTEQPPEGNREAQLPPANRPSEGQHKVDERQTDTRRNRTRISKRRPRRPADTWVIFREAFQEKKDVTCTTQWIRRNRFRVKTDNIRRLTVDLTRLPTGAPRKGPWIIIIDGQGVEMTGFIPKPGYTGLKRDLVRSSNGQWTVDRRKLYRAGR